MGTKESAGALSKSDAVREYLAKHATTPVKEIAKALSEQGVDVSIALINKVKYSDRKPGRGRKAAGRRGRAAAAKGTSKAQAIRDALAHLGRQSRPRDIIAHLNDAGITVTAAQVSAIRKVFGKGPRGQSKRGLAGFAGKSSVAGGIAVEHLLAAKRLADEVGLEKARLALEFLVKLGS
ncbi:MAG TPA: hypothetical protein VMF30_05315 [Pirellulales bacterium]|nr:hypothetical protein [Pirellulales bacterium]